MIAAGARRAAILPLALVVLRAAIAVALIVGTLLLTIIVDVVIVVLIVALAALMLLHARAVLVQHAKIVIGELQVIFGVDAIPLHMRVTRKILVFLVELFQIGRASCRASVCQYV